MVRLTDEGFCIEIKSNQPASDYVELQHDIIELLQSIDPELSAGKSFYHLFELLKNLLPDDIQAKKILIKNTKLERIIK